MWRHLATVNWSMACGWPVPLRLQGISRPNAKPILIVNIISIVILWSSKLKWIFVSKWVPVMNSCPYATLSRPRCLHRFELIFNTKPTFLCLFLILLLYSWVHFIVCLFLPQPMYLIKLTAWCAMNCLWQWLPLCNHFSQKISHIHGNPIITQIWLYPLMFSIS